MLDWLRGKSPDFVERLVPRGDVGERTAKSGVWMGLTNAVDRVLKLSMLVFLARLLGPQEIGLYGIALLALSALRRSSRLGVKASLVQMEDDDVDRYLDTAFSLQLLRGTTIAAVLYAAAPTVAAVFGEPRATDLLRVIGIALVVKGLKNPGIYYFEKNLAFHKQFVYRVSGTVIHVVVAVAYGVAFGTAWALVFGYVADAIFTLLVTYALHPYRPWPEFNWGYAREMVGYGKWITGATLLGFLNGQGDDAVVGWLLSAASLGMYQMAYRLSNAPATEITMMLSGVMFPAYSKLQGDLAAVREAFFRTLRLASFVAFPVSFGIVAVAPTFVRAFLGPDWTPMILVMQILGLYGLLRTVSAAFKPVWKALGRPDLLAKVRLLRVVLLAVLIIPATQTYGIVGTAMLVTGISVVPMLPVNGILMTRTLDTTLGRFVRELSFALVASGLMALAVVAVRETVTTGSMVTFVLLVVVGVLAYTAVVAALVAGFDWEIKRNLEDLVRKIKS